jgi:hypothetical protein
LEDLWQVSRSVDRRSILSYSPRLLDDIAQQNLAKHIANLRKALLVFRSPTDDTVGIDNEDTAATLLFGSFEFFSSDCPTKPLEFAL